MEALFVVVAAVLPGALHTWAFEREVGNWGIGLADRLLRFVGVTAVYHALGAFLLYSVWVHVLHVPRVVGGTVRYVNLLDVAEPLPLWSWLVPLAYIGVPLAGGTLAAMSIHRWHRFARVLVGKDPAPRAWDFVFSPGPEGVVRLRLKDDSYIGGLFSGRSYAAGYPDPKDLFLERTYLVLANGEFAEGASPTQFVELGSAVLIDWSEVKYLEVFPIGDNIWQRTRTRGRRLRPIGTAETETR